MGASGKNVQVRAESERGGGRYGRLLAGLIVVAALLLPAAQASAARPLTTGFADLAFISGDPQIRDRAFEKAVEVGAGIARLPVFWNQIASGPPANPIDPGDPAYSFDALDAAVIDAHSRGLEVLLTVSHAPAYAEAPDRPAYIAPGSWRPSPLAFAQFAAALAIRYSGVYPGPSGPLPRVRLYQAWNEPNLETYLSPQYEGGALFAASHYREMLNAFYDAVKAVRANNRVITAGTAPYGDATGSGRSRPLTFWRDVLCLSKGKLTAVPCPAKARFDVLAHHPINTSGGPRTSARNPDDASTPDFGNVVDVLRAAERHGTVGTPGRHQAWATEIWWETNPPDTFQGVPLRRQARWLAQAQYLLWEQRARVIIGYPVIDLPYEPNMPFNVTSSGILFADGTPKPAARSFAFPFVVERRKRASGIAWGRSPRAGKLRVESRVRGKWVRVGSVRVKAGATFKARVPLDGSRGMRARVSGIKSPVWRIR